MLRHVGSNLVSTYKAPKLTYFYLIGATGYYVGTFATCMMLNCAIVVYFIILTQTLYPLTLALYAWTTGDDPQFHEEPTLQYYSTSYVALGLFLFLTAVCLKTDLGFFMKVSSLGVIFLLLLILFIVIKGLQSFSNTDFMIGTAEQSSQTDWQTSLRTVTMINGNFSPIAGVLCAGYFLHVIGVPILRNAKEPKNNDRDLFYGYFLVFLSYLAIGGLGYIGFIGFNFAVYFQDNIGSTTAG